MATLLIKTKTAGQTRQIRKAAKDAGAEVQLSGGAAQSESIVPPIKSKGGFSFLSMAGSKRIGDLAAVGQYAKKLREDAWERSKK